MSNFMRSCGFAQNSQIQVQQFPNFNILMNVAIKMYCYWGKSVPYSSSENRAFSRRAADRQKKFMLL